MIFLFLENLIGDFLGTIVPGLHIYINPVIVFLNSIQFSRVFIFEDTGNVFTSDNTIQVFTIGIRLKNKILPINVSAYFILSTAHFSMASQMAWF